MIINGDLQVSESEKYDYILDAWALLAHFGSETGADRVRGFLRSAADGKGTLGMSLINFGEVATITERERGLSKVYAVLSIIHTLPIALLKVEDSVVLNAAHIKAHYRLSYAGAFAAATARLWGGKLITGDPELKALDGREIIVEWIGN